MEKRIGLIGATASDFFARELLPIIDRHRYAWYGWTIPIRKEILPVLRKQGSFNLYGYSSSGCYPNPKDATHKVEAVFIVDASKIKSHWDTGRDANPCPEPEKAIRGPNDFFTYKYEVREYPKLFRQPRRTWFAVINAKKLQPALDLSDNIFTPWNSRHKIHTSPLRSWFIDIVDNLAI